MSNIQYKQASKPQNMSQLDYLWTYFGPYSVSETYNKTPASDKILTEAAVVNYINEQMGGSVQISNLDIVQKNDKLELQGLNSSGNVIASVILDKDTKTSKFQRFESTQEDVDNNIATKTGESWIVLQDTSGQSFYVSLSDFQYVGQSTNTINITVAQSKIAGELKINNPIIEPTIEIRTTTDGIRADLIVDSATNSGIVIEKGGRGISCHYRWEGSADEIKFKSLTYDEYVILEVIDSGTLYFITDLPRIYFRGIAYASSTALVDYFTKEEVTTLINAAIAGVSTDIDRIDSNISSLRTDISNTVNSVELKQEADRAKAEEARIETKAEELISAETERATAAEQANLDAISALDTAYKAADATLSAEIDTKVSKIEGKGLSTNDFTDADKALLSTISKPLNYKGSVATYADLPTNASEGDVYNVVKTDVNYAWTGAEWDPFGSSAVSVVNDLTTGGTTVALSAEQGRTLKTSIDNVPGDIVTRLNSVVVDNYDATIYYYFKSRGSDGLYNSEESTGSVKLKSATSTKAGLLSAVHYGHLARQFGRMMSTGSVTTLSDMHISTYKNVKATLNTSAETLSIFTQDGGLLNGETTTIYVYCTDECLITIPTTGTYVSMCGSSYRCPANTRVIFNITKVGNEYYITKLEQEPIS